VGRGIALVNVRGVRRGQPPVIKETPYSQVVEVVGSEQCRPRDMVFGREEGKAGSAVGGRALHRQVKWVSMRPNDKAKALGAGAKLKAS